MKPWNMPWSKVNLTGHELQTFLRTYERVNGAAPRAADYQMKTYAWQQWLPYLRGEQE